MNFYISFYGNLRCLYQELFFDSTLIVTSLPEHIKHNAQSIPQQFFEVSNFQDNAREAFSLVLAVAKLLKEGSFFGLDQAVHGIKCAIAFHAIPNPSVSDLALVVVQQVIVGVDSHMKFFQSCSISHQNLRNERRWFFSGDDGAFDSNDFFLQELL